jgi:predicted RNA binding protein YcfA (HicA-like mRNA interferase family)
MSRKLPDLKAKEVVLALQRAGFAKWRQKGSHLTMFRPDDRRALTVPMHFSKSVPRALFTPSSAVLECPWMNSAGS